MRPRPPGQTRFKVLTVATCQLGRAAGAELSAHRPCFVGGITEAVISALASGEGAVAEAVQIVVALGEMLKAQVQARQIVECDRRADHRNGIIGAVAVQAFFITDKGINTDIPHPRQPGLDPFKTIPGLPGIVTILKAEVVDVNRVVQISEVQGVLETLARSIDDIGERPVTLAFLVRVGGHHGTVETPRAALRQVAIIYRMNLCIGFVMSDQCAYIPQPTVCRATAAVFIQNTERREVASALFKAPIVDVKARVIFRGAQNTVTHPPYLARRLDGTQQVGSLDAVTRR